MNVTAMQKKSPLGNPKGLFFWCFSISYSAFLPEPMRLR